MKVYYLKEGKILQVCLNKTSCKQDCNCFEAKLKKKDYLRLLVS